MNAWKLATDVHHLDMCNKDPFTFDFAECHLVVQAPGSDGFLRNLSLLQKAGSFTSYSEDIQPWVQSRAQCILPNWSQIQQSGTAGHFTNKLPYILKCKKQENFKWEETAQSLLTEQGSSTIVLNLLPLENQKTRPWPICTFQQIAKLSTLPNTQQVMKLGKLY